MPLQEDIYEVQFDTVWEWPLVNEGKWDSSPAAAEVLFEMWSTDAELLFELLFIQDLNCIGLEQRNASFLTSVGLSLDKESWFGVLSFSCEESVDSFVSASVFSSLSELSSLGLFSGGSICGASSKNTTMTLVLSALKSRSRHFAKARCTSLLVE